MSDTSVKQALICRCNPPGGGIKCPEGNKCGYLCLFLQNDTKWVWPGNLIDEIKKN